MLQFSNSKADWSGFTGLLTNSLFYLLIEKKRTHSQVIEVCSRRNLVKFRLLPKGVPAISEVSTLRLYLLRALYLYMFVGLAIYKWPRILNPPPGLSNQGSVVGSVLGAVSLLALLGIRYPIKMLPLLFFELLWKSMWVLGWGLPYRLVIS